MSREVEVVDWLGGTPVTAGPIYEPDVVSSLSCLLEQNPLFIGHVRQTQIEFVLKSLLIANQDEHIGHKMAVCGIGVFGTD